VALCSCPLQRLSVNAYFGRAGARVATWGRSSMQQALDADVFVNIGPMNSLAGSDDAQLRSLRRRGFGQPPRPRQRNADDSPVDEVGNDLVSRDADLHYARLAGTSHSARATLEEYRQMASDEPANQV